MVVHTAARNLDFFASKSSVLKLCLPEIGSVAAEHKHWKELEKIVSSLLQSERVQPLIAGKVNVATSNFSFFVLVAIVIGRSMMSTV
jgi:hypothetical protein